MSAQIIDGKRIATQIRSSLTTEVASLKKQHGRAPGLAVILVGNDPASKVYVSYKNKACEETGIKSVNYELPADTKEDKLQALIAKLNADPKIDGILVQLPLPEHINTSKVVDHIAPAKDVDGFNPVNMGLLTLGRAKLRPCTPKGVISLLDKTKIDLTGTEAVVIGCSNIVGRPMALELLAKRATVSICHSKTRDLSSYVKRAEILIVAVGIANFIPGAWIKPEAVVIDVGINRLPDGSLTGDVNFAEAKQTASFITPVPGGVGPMTIASLMENTLLAYKGNNA